MTIDFFTTSPESIKGAQPRIDDSFSVLVQFCNLNGSTISPLAETDPSPQKAYLEWHSTGTFEDKKRGEQVPFSLPSIQVLPYKGLAKSAVCNILAEVGSGANGKEPLRYQAAVRGLHELYVRLAEAGPDKVIEVHIPTCEHTCELLKVLVKELAEDSKIPTTLYLGS